MSAEIAIRLDDDELTTLDIEVQEGRAESRSGAVHRGIAYVGQEQRYRCEAERLVELACRGESAYPGLEGLRDLPHPPLD